ncbi:MAG: cell division protein ZipA C-terminal FtsZ-binding domain-containing protein [Pseudomonadota bacterium]|nr:cell division protein ZipA C-terminal FtsZ-binding domain-containing protein [Pseudomonadota bacterium]
MDILVAIGMTVALIMIALGIYLLFLRKSKATAAPAPTLLAPEADEQPDGRPPIVPRAARTTQLQAQTDSVEPSPIGTRTAPAVDAEDAFAKITPQQGRQQPEVVADAEPAQAIMPEALETDSLDTMLDDLEQATAKLIPPVERGEVAEWQGDSALLDAHLHDQTRRDDESTLAQAEQVVALYLLPTEGRSLDGARVLQLLKQYGLRFGEMSLFHRFAESSGEGSLMFSVLRYTPEGPQGFDLESLPQEKIGGLAFFLALPNPEAVNGYDMMASISSLLARDLSAHLYDEEMNPFTKQLKAHYRHVVLEFKPKG